MSRSKDHPSIELPEDMVLRIKERVKYTEFESVSGYVEYVMEEVLCHVEQETEDSGPVEMDEQEVKDRLESLGYLE